VSASTRERITATALDLFHANGYSATGVLDITKAAGVPKGSFYHFFQSKEALAAETVRLYQASLKVELLDPPKLSPLRRIRQHLEYRTNLAAAEGFKRGCLLGNFSNEMPSQSEAVTAVVEQALEHWSRKLAAAIAAAQEAGEISNQGDPGRLAGFIIAGFEGAMARAKLTHSRTPLDGFLETVNTDILI
jgi:TetR/AcrR family transcriptional regulator, transcriptional repressor for nem operon